MLVIGVDVGFKGGISVLDLNLKDQTKSSVIDIIKMPIVQIKDKPHLDRARIRDIFSEYPEAMVVIEAVHAMPKQGVVSTFRFGEQYDCFQTICVCQYREYHLVTPQKWKKLVLENYEWKGDKKMSVKFVQDKYSYVNLLLTKRSRKPSDGLADAICIAEYGKFLIN